MFETVTIKDESVRARALDAATGACMDQFSIGQLAQVLAL
jgi:hypothetical protein